MDSVSIENYPLLLKNFSKFLIKKGKQRATVESYQRDAQGFLNYLENTGLKLKNTEPSSLVYYQAYLASQNGRKNSIRRTVIGVRQFFRFLSMQKTIIGSPFEGLALPERDEFLKTVLKHEDITQLISYASENSHKLKASRDAAIIPLLAYEGIKVSELILLRWSDFIVSNDLGSLRITGQRTRIIQLRTESCKRLSHYKKNINQMFSKKTHPLLHKKIFISFKGREKLQVVPGISRHGLKFMLYELGAKIDEDKLNSEMLRHFATSFHLSLGKTPEEIMLHFGLNRIGNIGKHLQKIKSDEAIKI